MFNLLALYQSELDMVSVLFLGLPEIWEKVSFLCHYEGDKTIQNFSLWEKKNVFGLLLNYVLNGVTGRGQG